MTTYKITFIGPSNHGKGILASTLSENYPDYLDDESHKIYKRIPYGKIHLLIRSSSCDPTNPEFIWDPPGLESDKPICEKIKNTFKELKDAIVQNFSSDIPLEKLQEIHEQNDLYVYVYKKGDDVASIVTKLNVNQFNKVILIEDDNIEGFNINPNVVGYVLNFNNINSLRNFIFNALLIHANGFMEQPLFPNVAHVIENITIKDLESKAVIDAISMLKKLKLEKN